MLDRQTILAIILCFLIFVGWQKYYIEPRTPAPGTQTAQTTGAPASPSEGSGLTTPGKPAEPKELKPDQPLVKESLETGTGTAVVGNGNRLFLGWNLASYKTGISEEAADVDLKDVTFQEGELELAFDSAAYSYLSKVRGQFTKTESGLLWSYEDENIAYERLFKSDRNKPFVDVDIRLRFKKQRPAFAFVSLSAQSPTDDPEEIDRQLVYYSNEEVAREAVTDLALEEIRNPVQWIGAASRYFLFSTVSREHAASRGLIQPTGPRSGRISSVYPVVEDTMRIPLRVYFGPKEIGLLREVTPSLENTVDFGFFSSFAYWLLVALKWFHDLSGNWGVAIIILTILVRSAVYPLTYKSMKSMKQMQKIQPEIQRLREKYKDNKEALNREMLTLMRSKGYNPVAGCLPILVQLPIFFALYKVLYSSVELYQAPFILWIQDLSDKDPFYVTPILMSLVMYVQQKLTPTQITDPTQAKMMQLMPLIIGVFMLTLPAGLTLYMLTSSVVGVLQQMVLNKKLGITHAPPTVAAGAR